MPNTREKLIDMVFESLCAHSHKSCKLAENIADDLIANSVTINRGTEDTPVAYKMSPTESLTNCQQWIPVTERLPEEKQLVLAVCKSGKMFVGYYWNCHGTIIWAIRTARDSTKKITQIVTHWMPLPDPPEGE